MVYPNPYKDRHFNAAVKGITFENLTENTDVRIYNIAGDLVWKAEDIDDNEVLWEVCNESAKPVASGVYIYVITNDANGRVKGKVAVIR